MAPGVIWCPVALTFALIGSSFALTAQAFVPSASTLLATRQAAASIPGLSVRYGDKLRYAENPLTSTWYRAQRSCRGGSLPLAMSGGSRGHPALLTSPLLPRLAAVCAIALHISPRSVQAADFHNSFPPAAETVVREREVRADGTKSPKVSFVTPKTQSAASASSEVANVQLVTSEEWGGLVKASGLSKVIANWWADVGEWTGYKLTQVLSSTGLRLLTIAIISTVLVALGGWMLLMTGVGSWKEALFKSYALLNNAPGVSAVDEEDDKSAFAVSDPPTAESKLERDVFAVNTIFFVGMLTFAVVIGIVTASIEEAVDSVLAGDHRVVESGHIVMLNWNSKTVPMLKQIQAASTEGRVKETAVVILSEREREEMEEQLRDEFPDQKIQVFSPVGKGLNPHVRLELQQRTGARVRPKPVPVVTRSGSPSYLPDLLRVSAGRAKHVVIVPPEDDDSLETLAVQTSCLDVLQRARQPNKVAGAGDKDLHVVISDYDVDEDDVQPGPVLCSGNSFTERAIASALSQEGVMEVYNQILDQHFGSEIYLKPVQEMSWMAGKPFKEVVKHFRDTVVLGWVDYSGGKGEVVMNPPGSEELPSRASVLVLAPDEASIRVSRNPHIVGRRSWSPSFKNMRSALAEDPRNVLVLNFNPDTDPLEEIDDSLPYGSKVAVLSPDKVTLPKPKNVKMEHWVGDPFSLADVAEMDMSKFDSVVISAGGLDGAEGDSKVMGAANVIMKAKELTAPDTPPLRLITVFHNKQYSEILEKSLAAKKNLVDVTPVLSTRLESGALIQILWHPDMRDVYEELLDPEGAQVVMVDAAFFAPPGEATSFGEIADRAVENGGVAMGVKDKSGKIRLCPSRGRDFKLQQGDKVVVLCDVQSFKMSKR